MTLRRLSFRSGFTLVELLVVIAIVAVVGAGVAVSYGREVVVRARRQMTLDEMGRLREAFRRFHAENAPRLLAGLHEPHDATLFPSNRFLATFAARPDADDRVYGMLEFLERYGLWPLFQPAVAERDERLSDADFVVFADPDPLTGEGWQGPYADGGVRVACVEGNRTLSEAERGARDPLFPQAATRFGGLYRVVYYEHCEDDADPTQPIRRRLFLLCAENPEDWDEPDELDALTGNRRRGGNDGAPLDLPTGTLPTRDDTRGLFLVELLNLDIWGATP